VVIVAVGLIADHGDNGTQSSGPLSVQTTHLALGTLVPGEHVVKTLSLRNTGDKTLHVRLRTSDPVIRASLSHPSIGPGRQVTLSVQFRPDSWDGEGAFAESVFLYSSAPAQPLVKIGVQGVLKAPFTWQPKVPVGQPMEPGGKPWVLTHVSPGGSQPLGPIAVTSRVPYTYARAVPNGRGYDITLSAQPGAPLGPAIGEVVVDTFNPSLPQFEVPVRTTVVHNLLVNPYSFNLGFVESGHSATASVRIQVRKGHHVRVLGAQAHVPAATIVSVSRGSVNSRITLRIPSVPRGFSLNGYVNVFTSDPSQPVLEVPVMGAVWMPKPFREAAKKGSDDALYDSLKAVFLMGQDKVTSSQVVSEVLGGVRDQRAVTLLLRAMRDANWYVRQRAVNVLGYIHATSAISEIRSAVLFDPQSDVRDAAELALVQLEGDKALPELLLALRDNDDYVRDDAATLLGKLGDPRAVPALLAAQNDPDPLVRQLVQKALTGIDKASSSPTP
jgi:hypothetical protein